MTTTHSQYAKLFDDSSVFWVNNMEQNEYYIKMIQSHLNDILRLRGYLFLRDVYEKLGIPITKESCLVGWVYEKCNTIGDNFVELKYEADDNNYLFIDFNVDGYIIDRF